MRRAPSDPGSFEPPEARRLDAAARQASAYAMEQGLWAELEPYRSLIWHQDAEAWPVLALDDYSGIPFLKDIAGIEAYQHRARIRAGSGDLFATVTPATPGYEPYCRDALRLGEVELIEAEPVGGPLEVARACGEGEALRKIVAKARASGGLVLHPYMGIAPVWALAKTIADHAGVGVRVLGPPPPVTWIANDKRRLAELSERVAGPSINADHDLASDPASLADGLARLAARHARVGIKRPRCASAMGNRVYDSEKLRTLAPEQLLAEASRFWADKEVEPDEPVLVVAWEDAVASPSTQMWIPERGFGPPQLDGVYEQLLEGEEKVFLGSQPSLLPRAVEDALAEASYLIAAGLQALGYVGRCSFDFIVVGDMSGDFEVRVTDCNGRWGGTSTPMLLVERTVSGPRGMYHAQDFVREALVGMPFTEVLARVGDAAYDHARKRGRFLFYNVGCLANAGKLDVVVLGDSREEVEHGVRDELPKLLGVPA